MRNFLTLSLAALFGAFFYDQALASETTYYRTVEYREVNVGFIAMLVEARWLIAKLFGAFTPVIVLLFYFSLKYQDKLNVRSANDSKAEMRSMERFNRVSSGTSTPPKAKILNVREQAKQQETPSEYIYQRGQRSFASTAKSRSY